MAYVALRDSTDKRRFVMVIVVCFVGGMLYYSMNVLWPQQSAQLFLPADAPIMRGLYSSIFPWGSLREYQCFIRNCSPLTPRR